MVSQVRFRTLRRNENGVAVVANGDHIPLPSAATVANKEPRRIAKIVDRGPAETVCSRPRGWGRASKGPGAIWTKFDRVFGQSVRFPRIGCDHAMKNPRAHVTTWARSVERRAQDVTRPFLANNRGPAGELRRNVMILLDSFGQRSQEVPLANLLQTLNGRQMIFDDQIPWRGISSVAVGALAGSSGSGLCQFAPTRSHATSSTGKLKRALNHRHRRATICSTNRQEKRRSSDCPIRAWSFDLHFPRSSAIEKISGAVRDVEGRG